MVAEKVRTGSGVLGDAVLIEDRRVATVGRAEELAGPAVEEHRYPGGVIVPGLGDAHFHPLGYTAAVTRLSLKDAGDMPGLADRLRAAAAVLPSEAPLIGQRLDDQSLAEGRLPTRQDLDRAVPERPVLLYRYCGHIAVANTAALDLAGIGPTTSDPEGGWLDRDGAGVPTGVLRETAVRLVADVVGKRTTGLPPQDVLQAMTTLTALGLTDLGAIVAGSRPLWCGVGEELTTLIEVAADLPLNLDLLVTADHPAELEEAARRIAAAGPRLRFIGWKEFADGSLGGHTAAMHEPYSDLPGERGIDRLVAHRARTMASVALGLGGKVAIHAIGDRANDAVLDLYEELIDEGAAPQDLRVEHASVLTGEAVERFGWLGVIASVQPAFLGSEAEWLGRRLGPDRLSRTYPFRSLLETGVTIAGGSDCPVEPPSPLWGMATAQTRAGLMPTEALSGGQALALFTDGVAAAAGRPPPLASGSAASLTILSGDPVEVAPDRLHHLEVLATWVEGAPVAVAVGLPWPG